MFKKIICLNGTYLIDVDKVRWAEIRYDDDGNCDGLSINFGEYGFIKFYKGYIDDMDIIYDFFTNKELELDITHNPKEEEEFDDEDDEYDDEPEKYIDLGYWDNDLKTFIVRDPALDRDD